MDDLKELLTSMKIGEVKTYKISKEKLKYARLIIYMHPFKFKTSHKIYDLYITRISEPEKPFKQKVLEKLKSIGPGDVVKVDLCGKTPAQYRINLPRGEYKTWVEDGEMYITRRDNRPTFNLGDIAPGCYEDVELCGHDIKRIRGRLPAGEYKVISLNNSVARIYRFADMTPEAYKQHVELQYIMRPEFELIPYKNARMIAEGIAKRLGYIVKIDGYKVTVTNTVARRLPLLEVGGSVYIPACQFERYATILFKLQNQGWEFSALNGLVTRVK